jgi:hypothetical protein
MQHCVNLLQSLLNSAMVFCYMHTDVESQMLKRKCMYKQCYNGNTIMIAMSQRIRDNRSARRHDVSSLHEDSCKDIEAIW